MGSVNIENLYEGLVLLEDVKSGKQILLPKGAILTDKHISIFKSWGVKAVDVEGVCELDITNKKLDRLSP